MSELQKCIQSSNGSFMSDLMKGFVAKHKGYNPSTQTTTGSAAPEIFNNQNANTGAGIFPVSTTTTAATTTTTTTTGGTTAATTDNANIMMQHEANNNQSNLNNNGGQQAEHNLYNANLNTTTTSSAAPEKPDTNANVREVNAVLEEVKRGVPENLRLLTQQMVDATVDAHLATVTSSHEAVTEARARIAAMQQAAGAPAMPDMSKLSLSAGSMWEKMMDQMIPELGNAVKFCKMLPGFCELPLDDQMKLIKHGSFEVMMVRFCALIDHEKETMMEPSLKMIVPRHIVKATPMGKFMDGFFYVGAQVNPLSLTDGELGLFAAILIFSPSRPGLSDVKLVSSIQSLYQQALYSHIKQNHSDPDEKFSQALGLVPMFRRINEEHSKSLGAMKMQNPDGFDKQFSPLHKELYLEK